ncbi:hypothetical protein PPUN12996_21720 [Pseudomonas putida]|nr:hypothetical protein PPUN12996_21720 [Pseudomonas putida]
MATGYASTDHCGTYPVPIFGKLTHGLQRAISQAKIFYSRGNPKHLFKRFERAQDAEFAARVHTIDGIP